jgi:NifB/MoaA-like Fe-S oxidoreductase
MKQAENIAEFMNANLDDVSITLFAAHPMFRNK